MPKLLTARPPLDEREEKKIRKLAVAPIRDLLRTP
jgi:hypothetical protein